MAQVTQFPIPPLSEYSAKEQLLKAFAELSGLEQVEALIRSKFNSEASLLSEISQYLLDLGGKRIRPVLCLLTARALGMREPDSSVLAVSAGIELIHMATLLHDDIIDRSPMRRFERSPYSKYGIARTLICGDFLLTRAFSLCAHLDTYIIDATEQACIELTEGEILETSLSEEIHDVESSINIARKKTASLFRLSAESAAHLCGADRDAVAAAAEFGNQLGIAFQALDDILDVTSDESLLGKRCGTDIREQKPSLINVEWLASGDALAKTLLCGKEAADESQITQALNTLRGSAVVERAMKRARWHAQAAQNSLDLLAKNSQSPDMKTFGDLRALINYVLERLG